MVDAKQIELKPNIAGNLVGGILIFCGAVMAFMGIGSLFLGSFIALFAIVLLVPIGWASFRSGMSMVVKRIQVYGDEIIIKEFLKKDVHIPAKKISSYENICARDVMRNNHREYIRWLTIYCSGKGYFFEYSRSAISGEAELMAYLDKCVK